MKTQLTLVKSENFGGVTCDFYQGAGEIWLTRRQIGEALGYKFPEIAIGKIHNRNKDRLDQFSRVTQIGLPSGGTQEVVLYTRWFLGWR